MHKCEIVLGRFGWPVDVALGEDPSISRLAAKIAYNSELSFFELVLLSKRRVYVNGEDAREAQGRLLLYSGDELTFGKGEFKLTFHYTMTKPELVLAAAAAAAEVSDEGTAPATGVRIRTQAICHARSHGGNLKAGRLPARASRAHGPHMACSCVRLHRLRPAAPRASPASSLHACMRAAPQTTPLCACAARPCSSMPLLLGGACRQLARSPSAR